jgi:hypothetical protein
LSSTPSSATVALTWGVFPHKEVKQPTVFDMQAFVAWSKEAFQLWIDAWATLYDEESESCNLMYDIHDTYYLVAIVDNDFVGSDKDNTGGKGSTHLLSFFAEVSEKIRAEKPDGHTGLTF